MIKETNAQNVPRTASTAGGGETRRLQPTRNGKVTLSTVPRAGGKCLAGNAQQREKTIKKSNNTQYCATV